MKYAEPNEVAAFAKPLYKIGSLKDVRLRAYFSAADVTKLKIGQKLSVAADFGTAKRAGTTGFWFGCPRSPNTPPRESARATSAPDLVYAAKSQSKTTAI